MERTGIIVVDYQNDFCEGGALAVKGGLALAEVINRLISGLPDCLVITTQDWHPLDSKHFQKWPVHCLHDSLGAEIVSGLKLPLNRITIHKGYGDTDGYSGFEGYEERTGLSLAEVLQRENIKSLYVCGIATDYCVKATVLDAQKNGISCFLVSNAIVGVAEETSQQALREMREAGASFITI
jgi:nicotinamidase/pyrazinamidase